MIAGVWDEVVYGDTSVQETYYRSIDNACNAQYPDSAFSRWWCKVSGEVEGALANRVYNPPMPGSGIVAPLPQPDYGQLHPGTSAPLTSADQVIQDISNRQVRQTQQNMGEFFKYVPTNSGDWGSMIPWVVGGVLALILVKKL